MDTATLKEQLERVAAKEAEELYHAMLARKWDSLYNRPGGASRLSVMGALVTLAAGGAVIATALQWPHLVPPAAIASVIGAMLLALLLCQVSNRYFCDIEARVFRELAAETDRRVNSPLYPLARIVAVRRVNARQAWVEKRMNEFLARKAKKDRRADIFAGRASHAGRAHAS
jgi:hypothetical protein